MSPSRKLQITMPAASFDETQLKLLASNSGALSILVDYLNHLVQKADEEFTQTARKAAFDPDLRTAAIRKKGVTDGIELVRDKMFALLSNGR